VGDYKFDVIAGRRAGCRTVLLRAEPLPPEEQVEWGEPDLVVASLRELLPMFQP
jgi:phosphoglycolate phosphatase-like HAD superfamily hydrolase